MTDDDDTLQLKLLFDPCYVFAGKTDINLCEKRVGTYGCMLSAAVCAFLAILSNLNAFGHHGTRTNKRGWGSYYFVSLFTFVTCKLNVSLAFGI